MRSNFKNSRKLKYIVFFVKNSVHVILFKRLFLQLFDQRFFYIERSMENFFRGDMWFISYDMHLNVKHL